MVVIIRYGGIDLVKYIVFNGMESVKNLNFDILNNKFDIFYVCF